MYGEWDGRCDVFLEAGRCEGTAVELLHYCNERCAGYGELAVCAAHRREHIAEQLLESAARARGL